MHEHQLLAYKGIYISFINQYPGHYEKINGVASLYLCS